MNNSEIRLMEDWRREQFTEFIKTEEVNIVDGVHLNTKSLNIDSINSLSLYSTGRVIPIIVRMVGVGEYELLFGLKQLALSKLLNHTHISAVIVFSENRREFIDYLVSAYEDCWDINEIKISRNFREFNPSPIKVVHKAKDMINGYTAPIIVDYASKYLIDGYITYLLLKFRGVGQVKVRLKK